MVAHPDAGAESAGRRGSAASRSRYCPRRRTARSRNCRRGPAPRARIPSGCARRSDRRTSGRAAPAPGSRSRAPSRRRPHRSAATARSGRGWRRRSCRAASARRSSPCRSPASRSSHRAAPGHRRSCRLQRGLGREARRQPEARGRIEQIVRSVIAEIGRDRADEEGPPPRHPARNVDVALVRGDQFGRRPTRSISSAR